VRHTPAGQPPSARIAATLGRLFGLRRVTSLLAVAAAVTGLAFAVPMVSAATTTDPVALDASSSSSGAATSADPPSSYRAAPSVTVQMGVDGGPAATPGTAIASPTPDAATPVPAEQPAAEASTPAAPADEPTSSSPADPAEQEAAVAPPDKDADEPAATEPAQAAPAAAAAAPADSTVEGQVLALVNEARATAGCAPLVADDALAAVARAHSADMRDRDYFSHDTPEGLSPFDRAEQAGVDNARAENIAFGQADAAAVMEAWMNSSGHRANILDCDLTKLGVGAAEGPGGPWWTQLFGV
jgi:uncharacterized protein YkwD